MIRKTLLILSLIGILYGCKDVSKKKIQEGSITYKVQYLCNDGDDGDDDSIIGLLPTTVNLKFKNNNISLTTVGCLGFFNTKFISTYEGLNGNILLKVLNNKYNYEFSNDDSAFFSDIHTPMKLEYCDSTKTIAGYHCKMAIIKFPKQNINPIKIFYNNDIGIKKPNRNTPFHQFDGVLMEIETRIENVNTCLVATQVNSEKISDTEFKIPEDYRKTPLKEMKEFFSNFD